MILLQNVTSISLHTTAILSDAGTKSCELLSSDFVRVPNVSVPARGIWPCSERPHLSIISNYSQTGRFSAIDRRSFEFKLLEKRGVEKGWFFVFFERTRRGHHQINQTNCFKSNTENFRKTGWNAYWLS